MKKIGLTIVGLSVLGIASLGLGHTNEIAKTKTNSSKYRRYLVTSKT